MPKLSTAAALVAATAAAGLGGAVIAGAADKSTTPTPTTPGKHDGRGHGGHGGPGFGRGHGPQANLAAVAKTLGVTEAELQKALEAARPDQPQGTTPADKPDRGAAEAAAIAKALGVDAADVTTVLESVRPKFGDHRGGPGKRGDRPDGPRGTTPPQPQGTTPPAPPAGAPGRPPAGGPGRGGFGGPDQSALVKALAKKFSVSEAKAQAAVDAARKAHDAERAAKQDELLAAVGKSLGKSSDEVKKAFEANRPTPPAKPGAPAPTTP